MQPLYNFLKMCNLCIAITINLFLPMSRWCLKVVGISKHLVWCHIFWKMSKFKSILSCLENAITKIYEWKLEWNNVIFLENQNLGESYESIMQGLYNFLKMCNLCIAITINLFLPMSRWYLEVAGISKHLVWCHMFWKMSKFKWKQWKAQLSCYTIF